MSISMAPNQRMYQTDIKQKDVNSSSMMPHGLDGTVFSKAIAPNILDKQKNPHHVFINNSGSFYFAYESSASYGTDVKGGYVLAMVIDSDQSGIPVRLDIQPCAWSASVETGEGKPVHQTGDVTFVYRGQ